MALFNVLFDIAAKTASFESAMTRIERKFTGLEAFAKKTGAALGIAFGGGVLLREIEQSISKQIELGDAMNKAAIKAGVQVEAFSALAYAAKQSDIPLESLSAGLKKMQVAVSGSAPIIKELGINFGNLRQLSPEQQLLAFGQAISQLKDPADRTRAAVELFGKSGTDLLPLFEDGAAGVEKLMQAAKDMGVTLTTDGAKALGQAQDSAKALDAAYESLWKTITIKTAPALTAFFDGLRKSIGGGTRTEILTDKISALKTELESLRGTNSPLIPTITKQVADLQAQLDASASAGTNLSGVVGNTTELKSSAKAVDEMAESMKRLHAISLQTETGTNLLSALDPLDVGATESGLKSISEMYQQLIKDTINWRMELQSDQIGESLKRRADEFTALDAKIKDSADSMSEYSKRAAQDIQSAFADFLFDPFANGLKGMLSGFLNVMRRMVAEIAAKQILESTGITAGIGSFFGAIFGGARASGGPVTAGTSYLVGERGPELFTPGASGSISPNSAMGSVVITQNIDARGSTNDSVTQLQEVMRQNNAALEARIIDGIRRRRYSLA